MRQLLVGGTSPMMKLYRPELQSLALLERMLANTFLAVLASADRLLEDVRALVYSGTENPQHTAAFF
jgi:hypothetical protein